MILPDDITEPITALKDQYFDLKGLSVYSALAVPTLRDYIREGKMPVFKLKGKILIKRSEFDRWMEVYRMKKKQDINAMVGEVMDSLKRQ